MLTFEQISVRNPEPRTDGKCVKIVAWLCPQKRENRRYSAMHFAIGVQTQLGEDPLDVLFDELV